MKKSFSPHKIGRFLVKNHVKKMSFYVNLSKKNNNKIALDFTLDYRFHFSEWLHRVERIRKYLEKLV